MEPFVSVSPLEEVRGSEWGKMIEKGREMADSFSFLVGWLVANQKEIWSETWNGNQTRQLQSLKGYLEEMAIVALQPACVPEASVAAVLSLTS